MEPTIAIVVVGALIWFGLAVIGSRKDENGMDVQDRYHHRKAMEREMGQAMANVAIGFVASEQRLINQGLTAEQALDVSRLRSARHRDHGPGRTLWQCSACDEAAIDDVRMLRLISDDPDALVSLLEAGEAAFAKHGLARRPEAKSRREEVEDLREQIGVPRSWSPVRSASQPTTQPGVSQLSDEVARRRMKELLEQRA